MSDPNQPRPADATGVPSREPRSEARSADHAAIERLASELLPALVAKLSATGLGELEVREGGWRIRLRRPAGGGGRLRRSTDRPSRAQPGHEGHGHAPAGLEGHRPMRGGGTAHSTNGSAARTGRPAAGFDPADARDAHRAIATSPAVGVFHPRPEVRPGTRVRAGDRLGAVDMLGVGQEVVAPADGIVSAILAEPGDAVEYGQDLVALELTAEAPSGGTR